MQTRGCYEAKRQVMTLKRQNPNFPLRQRGNRHNREPVQGGPTNELNAYPSVRSNRMSWPSISNSALLFISLYMPNRLCAI